MAQKFYRTFSWIPSGHRDQMEKISHRHGCCDLLRISRRRAHTPDYYPDRASVRECVKLLEEFLTDSRPHEARVSCRCRESFQDSWSLAMVLSPAFQVLCRRQEEERRLTGALRSPFQLLRSLFLQLDVMRRWNKMVTAAPWIQDLLEVCCPVQVPRPRGMCLSCRERRSVGSEVSAGKRLRSSRRCAECRHSIECLCHLDPAGHKDSLGTGKRTDPGETPGPLASVQQMKDSLKKDLETHHLYLQAIETRLSGLERRARDVTRHLERANLELEAIKQQGLVSLKTLVGEQISGERRSQRPEPYRRNDPGRRCASKYPAGGGGEQDQEDLQTELSTCQLHVDVLIEQITQQINQMESDIKVTSKLRKSPG